MSQQMSSRLVFGWLGGGLVCSFLIIQKIEIESVGIEKFVWKAELQPEQFVDGQWVFVWYKCGRDRVFLLSISDSDCSAKTLLLVINEWLVICQMFDDLPQLGQFKFNVFCGSFMIFSEPFKKSCRHKC